MPVICHIKRQTDNQSRLWRDYDDINLEYLLPSVHFCLAGRSYTRSCYFFNVISKLENLSGVATVTINLQRQSDRELLDILLVRYDVWLHREQRRRSRIRNSRGTALRQIDHRNTFLIEPPPGSPRTWRWKVDPRDPSREISGRGFNNIMSRHALRLTETKLGTSVM